MVHFIDFGNKEKIAFEDIRLIENKFTYMKYLPPQANNAFILNSKVRIDEIKELMYDAVPVSFEVLINANLTQLFTILIILFLNTRLKT